MAAACRACGRDIPDGSAYCNFCGASQSPVPRKLYRSTRESKILGVCGGFAEFWEVDPTLVRAGYAVLTFFSGILPGIILYFVLALIMPKR